jgi:hypothetical protein
LLQELAPPEAVEEFITEFLSDTPIEDDDEPPPAPVPQRANARTEEF